MTIMTLSAHLFWLTCLETVSLESTGVWDLNRGKEVCLSTGLLHVTSHQEPPRCEVARGMAESSGAKQMAPPEVVKTCLAEIRQRVGKKDHNR